MWGAVLLLGLVAGVRHALEADHVAAVAALAARTSSVRQTASLAAVWGAGHAATLMLVGALVTGLGVALPPGASRAFEVAAGLLLGALGLDVLRRLRRERVHFHVHRHGGGVQHIHAHSHRGSAQPHDPARHDHAHAAVPLLRAGVMGSLHGMAGSAALVVLSLQAVTSPTHALAYMTVFAAGSMAGMVIFSMAIAWPARLQVRHFDRASRAFQAALGVGSVVIGAWTAMRAGLGN